MVVSTGSVSMNFWLFVPEGNGDTNFTWSECISFDKVVVHLKGFGISHTKGLSCCCALAVAIKGSFTGSSTDLKRGNVTVKICSTFYAITFNCFKHSLNNVYKQKMSSSMKSASILGANVFFSIENAPLCCWDPTKKAASCSNGKSVYQPTYINAKLPMGNFWIRQEIVSYYLKNT